MENYLDKSIKNTRSFCQKFESTTKIQEDMGTFLKESGLEAGDEMGELMLKLGDAMNSLSTIHHAMAVNIVERYIQPSMKFQASMKTAQNAHKKYAKKRLETDGQVAFCKALSMKDPAKLDQEKLRLERERLKQIESERDEAFDESAEEHVELFVRKRTVHMNELCELMSSFHHFYAEGYTLTHNLLEYLDRAKQAGKTSAESLKKTPIDRVRTFDPDGQVPSSSSGGGASIGSPVSSSSSSSAASVGGGKALSASEVKALMMGGASTASSSGSGGSTGGGGGSAPKSIMKTEAIYDFAGDSTELSFSSGDVIHVTDKDDPAGWWKGYLDKDKSKRVATFPSNYTIAGSEGGQASSTSSAASSSSSSSNIAHTLYEYEATDEGELSFGAGEEILVLERIEGGWWRGKRQATGDIGLFPSNFTDLHTD